MQLKKTIISLLLLLTYSVGFAHNLVPHCTSTSEVNSHQHVHVSPDTDEDFISHGNHYDASLIDLIVCALSETDHPLDNCSMQHYLSPKTNSSVNDINTVQILTVLFTLFNDEIKVEKKATYITQVQTKFTTPLLEHSPHRGPPATFC